MPPLDSGEASGEDPSGTPEPDLVEPLPPLPPPPLQLEGTDERSIELMLRVGLLTDQEEAVFPCCGGDLTARWGDREIASSPRLRVRPDPGETQRVVFRLQVAALRDEVQAQNLAARLLAQTGTPADAVLDAESGFYRVRAGHFGTRREAEAASREWAVHGVSQAWVVTEGGGVSDPGILVDRGHEVIRAPGRWVAIESDGSGIRVGRTRYRGRVLVYLNDRGKLNIINELGIEGYLRGVVPKELGPDLYPELEALKAQTVAARTYTVRNLGEFHAEGYDICATPRCQVYGGMEVEHPLSDQAIRETAGLILLWRGQPIDALYSSTCGGHTEDAGIVFPLKSDLLYLGGVPCVESGVSGLTGAGGAFPAALLDRFLDGSGATAEGLQERLERLAVLAGLPEVDAGLDSLDPRSVRRYVSQRFDLAMDARLFVAPADLAYLVEQPPAGWSQEDRLLAAFFVKSGLESGGDKELGPAAHDQLLYRLARYLQVLRAEEVRFLSLRPPRTLEIRSEGGARAIEVPTSTPTFRSFGGEVRGADLSLVAGDRLELLWRGHDLIGVLQEVHREGAAYDRTSKWSSWRRFRTDRQIAASVAERLPGFDYQSFEILERGVSGRVGRIRLTGRDGAQEQVEGLAVRWTLDLPDTLFTAKRLRREGEEPGWLFTGRGWGHGVGLCQVGAYGMAVRGHSFREILTHYYRGIELGRVQAMSRTVRQRVEATTEGYDPGR